MPTIKKSVFTARKLISGLLTYPPFLHSALLSLREVITGQMNEQAFSSTAPYCYAVWMRHLLKFHIQPAAAFPRTVVEIGPGNSLGVGLAALLSGVDRYYALDAVVHMDFSKNNRLLDELLPMFLNKAPVPGQEAFPDLGALPSTAFPDHLLPQVSAKESLAEDRMGRIRKDLRPPLSPDANEMLFYLVAGRKELPARIAGSVDWILSQFVMEHVDDLRGAYKKFYDLLKPGGIMTHHIDFRSHWVSYDWNGYWTYGDWTWRLIRGKRPYFINRAPLSEHIACMKKAGFEVLEAEKTSGTSNISRDQLAARYSDLTEEDLQTMFAMITVRKPV